MTRSIPAQDAAWGRSAETGQPDHMLAVYPNDTGMLQLDEHWVTSLGFERHAQLEEPRVSLNFVPVTFDTEQPLVHTIEHLDYAQLSTAIGENNAKTIFLHQGDHGVLEGEQLQEHFGVSPRELARRADSQERQDIAALDSPMEAVELPNQMERVKQPVLAQIDVAEMLARASQLRERERLERSAQRLPALNSEQTNDIAGRFSKAQQVQASATLATPADTPFAAKELDKEQRARLQAGVHAQFHVVGSRFHFKENPSRLAFQDKGDRLVTGTNDDRVPKAMATLAQARDWPAIRVSGHPDFMRQVWLEARARDIQVSGYAPTEKDVHTLEEKRAGLAKKNVVQADLAGKTDRQAIIETVAAAVVDAKVTDPAHRSALKSALESRIAQRELEGTLLNMVIFDKKAKSQGVEQDAGQLQVKTHAERSR